MFNVSTLRNGVYLSERLRAGGDEDEDDDAGDPQGDGQLAVQEAEAPEVGLSGIQHSEKKEFESRSHVKVARISP